MDNQPLLSRAGRRRRVAFCHQLSRDPSNRFATRRTPMIAIHERVESLCRSSRVSTDERADAVDEGFVSSVPFEADRIGAAAIYCSDGRYGDQMDEFLHLGLGFPRYDRFAVPGGAACLADHIQAMRERSALE